MSCNKISGDILESDCLVVDSQCSVVKWVVEYLVCRTLPLLPLSWPAQHDIPAPHLLLPPAHCQQQPGGRQRLWVPRDQRVGLRVPQLEAGGDVPRQQGEAGGVGASLSECRASPCSPQVATRLRETFYYLEFDRAKKGFTPQEKYVRTEVRKYYVVVAMRNALWRFECAITLHF